ncbi:DUF6931 family protein [Azospirillum rugosum]|uniref:Secreted protein n=1 Tax=Azospirillum rugosum TaxID=416170 RepID=A0ABS4SKX9_9PROT|nr:hypothetical protein [Azospirillum rugosum]MBP2293219.1 hypothetical protein [Azospirillum rugosum]
MTAALLRKIRHRHAREVADLCTLDDAARLLLAPELSPADYLAALIGAGQRADAVRVLAHALPPREAVWWACVCIKATLPSDAPEPVLSALEAARAWVFQPSDANRRAAYASAQATDFQHAASWAAVGAFWSGGSMAPAGAPDVPVPDGLAGKAVAAAVILAAVNRQPERGDQRLAAFLDSGLDIAAGGNGRMAEDLSGAGEGGAR